MSLLSAPDPAWFDAARAESTRWKDSVEGVVAVHHIGSTAVPGLPARPILDLMPVFRTEAARENARPAIEALGYEWRGEEGPSGRAYACLDDAETGMRRVHAHGYAEGHPHIRGRLVFRDALRQNAALRVAYTSIRAACAARHPEGGAVYATCKAGWIDKMERLALERAK